MRKLLFTLSIAAFLPFQAIQPAHAKVCATNNEKQAMDFRAMQSMLMVAALSCNQQSYYNNFVNNNRRELADNASILKSYFSRVYKSNATQKLNNFITNLANQASQFSLGTPSHSYCLSSERLFRQVLHHDRPNKAKLVSANNQDFSRLHGIRTCK